MIELLVGVSKGMPVEDLVGVELRPAVNHLLDDLYSLFRFHLSLVVYFLPFHVKVDLPDLRAAAKARSKELILA